MKKQFIALFTVLTVMVACGNVSGQEGITNVKAEEFKTLVEKGDGIILDVRTPGETSEGFITDATLIDFFSDDFEAQVEKLDKSKTVYVYCKAGGRSAKAAKLLSEKGFKSVYNFDGGFDAWKDHKYPMTK